MPKRSTILIAATALVLAAPWTAGQALGGSDTDQLFQFYCAQCHGKTGDGKGPNVTKDFPVTPRAFNNATEMNKLTDADIKNVIREGGPIASKSPMMPPWGKTLTEAQIEGLLKKLRELCQCEGKKS